MMRKFEISAHAQHTTMKGIVEGETMGAIVDLALKRCAVMFPVVHGAKLEVDGMIIRLKAIGDEEAVQ